MGYHKGESYIGISMGPFYAGFQYNRLRLWRLHHIPGHWWIGPLYIQARYAPRIGTQ